MAEIIALVLIIWLVWNFLKLIQQGNNSHSSSVYYRNNRSIISDNRNLEKTPIEPLKGEELLEKVKEFSHVSKSELVQVCGYFVSTPKGDRLNYTAFYEALLEAKGISLSSQSSMDRSTSSEILSFVVRVNDDCEIEIGKEYTELIDLKPGDQLDIRMGRKGFRLILIDPDGKENFMWRFVDPQN